MKNNMSAAVGITVPAAADFIVFYAYGFVGLKITECEPFPQKSDPPCRKI